ncbi:MAG: YggS family pyridoxal phosphate-dependent enzyme [Cyanobacteria bacterium Co-bin8]|nr:YggS family pyridoxal phosphate-dependent enzyme [Cyanobacteria bacterium Co-bin8]
MTAVCNPDAIIQRITQIQATLPSAVRLVAVTKNLPVEALRAAYAAGIRDFGESRVQEAIAKQADLADLKDITWHMIGRLQANKARKALEHFQWIHSVDSLKLAERLNQISGELGCQPHCCLQVKMVPDPPKSGFELEELWAALPVLAQLTHLKLVGLMTIPPQGTNPEVARAIFRQAKDLAEQITQLQSHPLQIETLSMGMSGDYQAAIASGATMVRLGTILFGPRPD